MLYCLKYKSQDAFLIKLFYSLLYSFEIELLAEGHSLIEKHRMRGTAGNIFVIVV